jgi:hypothetical protein
MMVKAYVLVVTDPGTTKGVIEVLRAIPGIQSTTSLITIPY